MAKSVSLKTGRTFKTVSAAKDHFARLLDDQPLKEEFTDDDLIDIRAAYEAYCSSTNWILKSPPTSFYPAHDRGPGYTTRCYGVTFADGTVATFSMEKALRAIAN